MKKLALILIVSLIFIACENNDEVNPTSETVDSISEFLNRDNGLRITLFTDDEENETDYFDSYLFVFNSNGVVTAFQGSEIINGNYTIFRDEGRIELSMNFPDIQNFSELNDDWYFISINQNTIRFDDDGDALEFQWQ